MTLKNCLCTSFFRKYCLNLFPIGPSDGYLTAINHGYCLRRECLDMTNIDEIGAMNPHEIFW